MDKQTQREAARQIEDLPVEAEQSEEVKGGGIVVIERRNDGARVDPYKN
jgi:hypothetical protein